MLWYKLWIENRVRFGVILAVTLLPSLVYAFLDQQLHRGLLQSRPEATTYEHYVYWRIYSSLPRFLFQTSCMVLGLGGLQRERRQGALGFTLSLPIGRSWHVLSRAAFGMLELTTIAFGTLLVVWVLSEVLRNHLPLETTLLFALLWTVGGAVTFALSLFCSVLIPSDYTALAVVEVIYLFGLAAARLPELRPYPLHVTDMMNGRIGGVLDPGTYTWTGTLPMGALIAYVLAALLLVLSASYITVRRDM